MKKRRPDRVREPAQVYLSPEDSALLLQLTVDTGLSKAEILRRGIRSFAREQGSAGPMLAYLNDSASSSWPDEVALEHDRVLSEEYAEKAAKRKQP